MANRNPQSDRLVESPRSVATLRNAFTLVELLVVVAIIVVLLALLVPSMHAAIYRAELTVCGTRLKSIAQGVATYAVGNQRLYPYRPSIAGANASWRRPNGLNDANGNDDRPYLRDHISVKTLLDPLTGKYDVVAAPASSNLFSNYELWFGMTYATADGGKGMLRIGDKLKWTDRSRGRVYEGRFAVLASDEDLLEPSYPFRSCASHPDGQDLTRLELVNGPTDFISRWILYSDVPVETPRGPVDSNFAYDDGAVLTITQVTWDDDRMARVPLVATATPADVGSGHWIHLPR